MSLRLWAKDSIENSYLRHSNKRQDRPTLGPEGSADSCAENTNLKREESEGFAVTKYCNIQYVESVRSKYKDRRLLDLLDIRIKDLEKVINIYTPRL